MNFKIEKSFNMYKQDGFHPFFFLYELCHHTTIFGRIDFLSRHSLSEFTGPGITFDFPYETIDFNPETLEELIYALIMDPISLHLTEMVDFFRSDLNALKRIFRTMPVNMRTELLAYLTGENGVYHYDDKPLYLVPALREPDEFLYFRTTDMLGPAMGRDEILCQLTEEEKKALDGKRIFGLQLGTMRSDFLGLYDGVPCVFTEDEYEEKWFTKHARIMKDVTVPIVHTSEEDEFTVVPFIEEDHQDMENILALFDKSFYKENKHFKYGDFTDYYRRCILRKAMDMILS